MEVTVCIRYTCFSTNCPCFVKGILLKFYVVIYRDFINFLSDDEGEGDIETQQAIQESLQEVDNAAVTIESTSPERSVWKKIGPSHRNDLYHYGHLMHMYCTSRCPESNYN